MTNEELNTALYKKMFAEQEAYREWLLGQTSAEVLNHTYEYTMREDILLSLEYNDLSGEQAKALLKSPCPLGDVFKDWERRESTHMEEILETITAWANHVIRENFLEKQRKQKRNNTQER